MYHPHPILISVIGRKLIRIQLPIAWLLFPPDVSESLSSLA
jgi:hypothetical protein